MIRTNTKDRFSQIYFIAHVAAKTDVNRNELLKLLKQIKKLTQIRIDQ